MTADFSFFENQLSDDQLSPDMDNVMFERIADLRDRLADLTEVIAYLKTFLNASDDELADLERMRRSLQEILDEIRRRTNVIRDNESLMRRQISPYQQSLEASQREWVRLMAELEAQRREKANRERLALLVQDAPWRERALPHQWEGAYRLSSTKRAILGDQPGLGKTLQAIMTIDMLKALGEARKVLIFTPKPVLDGFRRDFAKFSPNQFVQVIDHTGKGVKAEILDFIKMMPECTILVNYEIFRRDASILDRLVHCQFDTVILDEAHNLKTFNSLTMQGIKQVVHAENKCSLCDGLTFGSGCPSCGNFPSVLHEFRSVKNVIPMTGTPILNRPQDLFSLLHLVDDIAFPDEASFLQDFCKQRCRHCRVFKTRWGRTCDCPSDVKTQWVWTFGPGGEEKLLGMLGMKYTARTRDTAGVKMPPQEVKHHYFELDPEKYPKQFEFNELLRDKARITFADRTVTEVLVIAWINRMRQSAVWPDGIRFKEFDDEGNFVREFRPQVGQSILMDEAEILLREAFENGQRVIFFSKFKEALKEMERRIKDEIPFVRFDGDLNADDRKEASRDFDLSVTAPKESKFKVMLAQYDSTKVGLNLHGAQVVITCDREWNPGMEKQAFDRVRRITGSDAKAEATDTIVHVLHLEGGGSDLIDAIIEMKEEMLQGFEDEVAAAEAMKPDNLRDVFRKFLEGDK